MELRKEGLLEMYQAAIDGSDRGGAGIGLEGSGVGETSLVVAELGEHPGTEQGTQSGEAEQDLAVCGLDPRPGGVP